MNTFFEKDSEALPEELDRIYEISSCLKYSDQTATYLLSEKNSGRLFLLKTSCDPVFSEFLTNEKNILEFIHKCHSEESYPSETFPTPVYLAVHQDTLYYIRTYIKGKTLEELCETNYKKPGLPVFQALDYIIALTELLHFLHNLNPPLIHRDIKPQNVVVDSEGICHFIDFGISRFYHTQKRSDTFIMGTRLTAPPEQFGYQQTDIRSDLYSLGILLFYCITGEYEVSGSALTDLAPQVRSIVQKATMFDPGKRYQTTDELLPDLLLARFPDAFGHSLKNRRAKAAFFRILPAFLIILNLGLALALITEKSSLSSERSQKDSPAVSESADADSAVYTFAEPLIEEAVRLQLNLPTAPITYGDLKKVSSLHIFGLQIYSDDSEIWFKGEYPWFYDNETRESGLYLQKGPISSLEDILHMPNLMTLSLYGQQISDVSLLENTSIKQLGLGYNPLTDLTPLQGNSSIYSLNLASLDISDTDIISTLPNLTSLNISDTGICSLKDLKNCPLKELNLFQLDLADYRELCQFRSLKKLELHSLSTDILDEIQGLPITDLSFYYSHDLVLDELSCLPNLEILFFTGDRSTVFRSDTPNLPKLSSLNLVYVSLEDFNGLTSLDALTTLYIYEADCQSYDGLNQIENLRTIVCTEEQKNAIQQQYPENHFIFNFY